ncbi:MAG: YggS family pyridoxal phosphate-dependent enzyme [Thermomicrobiales bacterium]
MIFALADQISQVREAVAEAAVAAGRAADEVTIVAVSKTFPREDVDAAFASGLRVFGENRVQEATAKFATPLPHGASVHLIGQLQTNKVKQALSVFDCIESVDRVSLINTLQKEAAKLDRVVAVLVQVNIAGEEQKSGCSTQDAADLIERIGQASHLRCDGMMTIAPLVNDPEETRPTFAALRELRDSLGGSAMLPMLSMGMSNDYRIAISEGATHIRLGRAIFGNRG